MTKKSNNGSRTHDFIEGIGFVPDLGGGMPITTDKPSAAPKPQAQPEPPAAAETVVAEHEDYPEVEFKGPPEPAGEKETEVLDDQSELPFAGDDTVGGNFAKSNRKNKKDKKKTKGSAGNYTAAPTYTRCYENHPAVTLGKGIFYGGSCTYPHWTGCDIYIGFQSGMHVEPFDPTTDMIIHIQHDVTDMCAPKDHEAYKNLVEWTASQLELGMTVHAGCIGGHGRTGTFLACLVKHMTGEEDAIAWVRKNYCEKAVETTEQINYLHNKWGIKKSTPSKSYVTAPSSGYGGGYSGGSGSWPPGYSGSGPSYGSKELKRTTPDGTFANAKRKLPPVNSRKDIFAAKLV